MLLVAIAATLFGTTGTARALGAPDASPLAVGAARLLVGGAALLVLARLGGARLPPSPPRLRLLVAGALVAAYQLCFFAGLDRAGVGVGTVVTIGSGPAFAGLLGFLVGHGAPGRRWAASTALAVAGVAILGEPTASGVPVAGIALALASGLGYAGYTVVAKGLIADGVPGDAVMAWGFAIGGVLIAPALLQGGAELIAPSGLATALYLGLLPTAFAYLLFARGLATLSAATVTTIVLIEPVVATVLGVVVLDEHLRPAAVAGCALVLAGVLLLALGAGARRRAVVAAD